MNYTVKCKNVDFPQWFYPTLEDLMEKWSEKNAQWLKNVHALTGDRYVKAMNFLSKVRMEDIGRSAWPLYIHTIDLYENKGWPKNIIKGGYDERERTLRFLARDILSLCDEYDFTDPEHHLNCILQISDKLRDSLIINNFQEDVWFDSLRKLEKLKIVHSLHQAKYFEKRIFEAFNYYDRNLIELACEWLEKKWISPIKYESEICNFFSKKIYDDDYGVNIKLKPKVLQSIYKYSSVYRKAAALYDEQVRRYNLERFERYRSYNDNDPSDFKARPFADGSCMKPIKRWFSWVLE